MTDNHDTQWEKIAARLHGELSDEEEAEFTQMTNKNPGLSDYEKARRIFDHLAEIGPMPANGKANSWLKVKKGIRRYQLRRVNVALKYAAIIVAAFIAGNLLKPSAPRSKEIRYSEIFVPFGQMSQLTLSDGTKVWLNSGTTLRYPEQFAENSRAVSIDGEAYFEVAKMAHKPFTINTADMNVEVLGTSFNLLAYHEDAATSVTLVEGKVAIQDNTGKILARLIPGQMATKNKNETTPDIQTVQTSFYSAWTAGKIYFDDEPLDQIATKLERWFNVEITFADEKIKSQKFSGTILKNKPVDQIMQVLQLLAPIRFKHHINANGKDKITIYKKT